MEKQTKVDETKTTKTKGTKTKAEKKEQMAKARASRGSRSGNDIVKFIKVPGEGDKKLAPQAAAIVNILAANDAEGKPSMTRDSLVAVMEGVVETKQPMVRIFGYYEKPLIEAGYIEVEKVARTEASAKEEAAK